MTRDRTTARMTRAALARKHHDDAMSFVDLAVAARARKHWRSASEMFRQAFIAEREAARATPPTLEPSWSVLRRSAAALAVECSAFRDAEQLIAEALAGEPPLEIAEELRDLLEQVHMQRHLDLRGMALTSEEMQLSIAGRSVGHGFIEIGEFTRRVENARRIILRTEQRTRGLEFREGPGESTDANVLVSVPRAASFAVTLRVVRLKDQISMFDPDVEPTMAVDEVMACFKLLNNGADSQLRDRIKDPAYYRNFVGLARSIAPDGDDVRVVGLTTPGEKSEARVEFKRISSEIDVLPEPGPMDGDPRVVTGRLAYADDRTRKNRTARAIELESEDGERHRIKVPAGMMTDIVRPLWGTRVTITGAWKSGSIRLEKIESAPEPA